MAITEREKIYQARYRERHREKINERQREFNKRNWDKIRPYRIAYNQNRRLAVIKFYSKGKMCCSCCGEGELQFLSIDHINGGGRKQSKNIRKNLYGWIIENGFPDGFQILCYNCNCAKGFYGECPHKK